MNDYKSLQIYSYEHPGESISNEVDKRLNGYGTIKFPLIINPIDKKEQVRLPDRLTLFLVQIKDYSSLLNTVRENSNRIKSLISELPMVASNQFFMQMLVDEIKGTNDIENVVSTTEEINKAIDNKDNKKKNVRLQSFAKMYFSIKEGHVSKIKKLEDIRKLYDFLLKGEISKNKLPDGKLFRNGYVRIGTSTKTVHFPKVTEDEINTQLQFWIQFINNDEIDPILKACISHYYFEYVHPFYDGNGRLGRYIFCSYIGKKLDPYTAISFSYQVNLKKTKYYKEFEEVENKKNMGETTFFVITLLKYLVSGQKFVLEKLNLAKKMLDYVYVQLNKLAYSDFKFSILFMYAQAYLFNDNDGSIEDRELVDILRNEEKISKSKIRKILDDLEQENCIKTEKNRPIKRKLTRDFIEKMGLHI